MRNKMKNKHRFQVSLPADVAEKVIEKAKENGELAGPYIRRIFMLHFRNQLVKHTEATSEKNMV